MGLAPPSAHAQEHPSYALSWTHGEGISGCASLSEVASAVEARLGYRVFASASDARRFIDARVESAPVGYRVVITVSDADGEKSGERSIATTDVRCRALDQPLSLMLALIIDPGAGGVPAATLAPAPRSLPAAPALLPGQPPTAAASPAPAVAGAGSRADAAERHVLRVAPSSATGSANTVSGAVELKLGFGILPGTASGLASSLWFPATPHWAALFGATMWAPRRTSDDDSRAGLGLEMSHATLGLCRTSGRARFAVLACARVEPGVLIAQSYGLRANSSRVKPTLDLALGARAAIKLGAGLSVLAGGDLSAPTVRSEFQAEDADGHPHVFFHRPSLGGSLSFGVAMHIFP